MKKILASLLSLVAATYIIFNWTAGIIGGFWLLLNGGWTLLAIGLLGSLLMPWSYTIVMLPEMLIIWPLLGKAVEKNNRFFVAILGFLAVGFEKFVVLIWVITVFDTLFYVNTLQFSPIALWLWGYSVVMGPIGYMAAKEGPDAGLGTTFGVFFAQIAYFAVSLNLLFGGTRESGYSWLWLVWLLFVLMSMTMGLLSMPKKENVTESELTEGNGTSHCLVCGKNSLQGSTYCKFCGNKL